MTTEQEQRLFVEMAIAPEDLTEHTTAGWEVVERFEFDEPITFQDSYIPQGQNYPQQVQRTQVGRSVGFRVRRAVDSPIAVLTAEIGALQAQRRTDEREKEKAAEALVAEQVKHQSTRTDLKLAHDFNARLAKERGQIEQIKHQLEADIGKIREHIGRKAFDEILSPPSPQSAKREGSQ